MTDRRHRTRPDRRSPSRRRRPVPAGGVLQPETIPAPSPLVPAPAEPNLFGLPLDPDEEPAADDAAVHEPQVDEADLVPVDDEGLYVLRVPDPVAGTLLMTGGAAGVLSLFLPWLAHDGRLGMAVLRSGLETADVEALLRSGVLLPVAVPVAGGLLFLLGVLAFRPARGHRVVGVVALVTALALAAGVVVRLADLGPGALRSDPGLLCAGVLSAAALLGALKAMLTGPEVTTDPGRPS